MTRTLPWQKPDPVKNYYPVPKVICQLGLSPGEIAVYSFLLFCEDGIPPLLRSIAHAPPPRH